MSWNSKSNKQNSTHEIQAQFYSQQNSTATFKPKIQAQIFLFIAQHIYVVCTRTTILASLRNSWSCSMWSSRCLCSSHTSWGNVGVCMITQWLTNMYNSESMNKWLSNVHVTCVTEWPYGPSMFYLCTQLCLCLQPRCALLYGCQVQHCTQYVRGMHML